MPDGRKTLVIWRTRPGGEAPFRDLFTHARYVALDNTVGDASWNYSRVGVIGGGTKR